MDAFGGRRDTADMTSPELPELVTIDPAVCHGQPCVKGTRVPVFVIQDAIAADLTIEEIVRQYPSLTAEGVRAAASYSMGFGWNRSENWAR
jgi:uncharacterized protein (DUF433 family)